MGLFCTIPGHVLWGSFESTLLRSLTDKASSTLQRVPVLVRSTGAQEVSSQVTPTKESLPVPTNPSPHVPGKEFSRFSESPDNPIMFQSFESMQLCHRKNNEVCTLCLHILIERWTQASHCGNQGCSAHVLTSWRAGLSGVSATVWSAAPPHLSCCQEISFPTIGYQKVLGKESP